MPLTLPSPSVGTAAHAAPDGPAAPAASVAIGSVPIGSVDGGSVVALAAPLDASVTIAAAVSTRRHRTEVKFI
jgi:hypothetical protein